MPNDPQPIVLELASLPREQIGPFLLLGVDKDADQPQIEAHWAQRIFWAANNPVHAAQADFNWARDELADPERRVCADITSLNTDAGDRLLARLARQYGVDGRTGPAWLPLELAAPTVAAGPASPVPDASEVEKSIILPDLPEEMPAVGKLLEEFLREPIDPWSVDLAPELSQDKIG